MSKDLKIELGGAPYEHLLTIGGEPWDDVMSMRIVPGEDNVPMLTFNCELVAPFHLAGMMVPTEGLPPERVPIDFSINGLIIRCSIAGHQMRVVDYEITASGDDTTHISLDVRLSDDYSDLTLTRIKGYLLPKDA